MPLLERTPTPHWRAAPQVVETLDELAQDHDLALLTGNPEPVARARMRRLGLDRFFPAGTGAFGCEAEQRADLVHLARRRAGDPPLSELVLVGDTPRDVEGAHEAGIRAIAVATGEYGPDRAHRRRARARGALGAPKRPPVGLVALFVRGRRHRHLRKRCDRAFAGTPDRRRLLGRLVRAVPPADARARACSRRARRRAREDRHRREPRPRAALRGPRHPRRQGVQERPCRVRVRGRQAARGGRAVLRRADRAERGGRPAGAARSRRTSRRRCNRATTSAR